MTYFIRVSAFHRVAIVGGEHRGQSPYWILIDSNLLHSIDFQRIDGDEVPNFNTMFFPGAEASGSPTEVYVSGEELRRVKAQLTPKPNFIELQCWKEVVPYQQIDGLPTGEGIGVGRRTHLFNANLIQSIAAFTDADGRRFDDFFTIRLPPARVGWNASELHVDKDEVRKLIGYLNDKKLASDRCFQMRKMTAGASTTASDVTDLRAFTMKGA